MKIFLVLVNLSLLFATVINVPDDYPTIQGGIDASADGDTVLVQPGVYVENINFNGRNITLTSSAGPEQTVIDGAMLGAVVTIENGETDVVLSGFTIRNGRGGEYWDYEYIYVDLVGGGISCHNYVAPLLTDLIVEMNIYCGILIDNAWAAIQNCEIRDNYRADTNRGSGLYASRANVSIAETRIYGNTSKLGGGIYDYSSDLDLYNVEIFENTADKSGAGMFITGPDHTTVNMSGVSVHDNRISPSFYGLYHGKSGGIHAFNTTFEFDQVNRSSVYDNFAYNSRDLYFEGSPPVTVYLDTFTVSNPTDYYVKMDDGFELDIQTGLSTLVASDFYVSPDGSDDHSGTTPDDPLKTISAAVSRVYADSLNPVTIHLLEGIYSPSATGETFPICPPSYLTFTGDSPSGTILAVEGGMAGFHATTIRELKLENFTLRNGLPEYSVGIHILDNTDLKLHNMKLMMGADEASGSNRDLSCYNSSLEMDYTLLAGDHNGVLLKNCATSLDHVTITNHTDGHGLYLFSGTVISISNSIVYGNGTNFAINNQYQDGVELSVSYSNIGGGYYTVIEDIGDAQLNWLEGNININPQFVDADTWNYQLSYYSPCIDAGDPQSPPDPDGTVTDMGLYYFDHTGFCSMLGDLNGDQVLDILDIISAAFCILNDEECDCADVDLGGNVNILDLAIMADMILNGD